MQANQSSLFAAQRLAHSLAFRVHVGSASFLAATGWIALTSDSDARLANATLEMMNFRMLISVHDAGAVMARAV
jgi:hypothetical protein